MSQSKVKDLNLTITKNRKLSFSHNGLAYFYTITKLGNRAELVIASECACNDDRQIFQFETLSDAKQRAYEHLCTVIHPLIQSC